MNIQILTNGDGYLAKCQDVQGAFAEGDTPYEALYNLWDVLGMIAQYKKTTFDRKRFEQGVEFKIPELV